MSADTGRYFEPVPGRHSTASVRGRWFTVIGETPEGNLLPRIARFPKRFPRNSAGQIVLWDGPANRPDIIRMAQMLSPYFGRLDAFSGKERGRCIFTAGKELPMTV